MREPIGTTRIGQFLLGSAGLIGGICLGVGLELRPAAFEPILKIALFGLGTLLRLDFDYDPSQRSLFAILVPVLGAIWALLFGYAFMREPARNRAIDTYLRRKDEIDQTQRATIISQDDRPA